MAGRTARTDERKPARAPVQGPSPDELGQRLRAAREAHGISLRTLAKRIDVSPSFISQVELGRASPSVGTLYALVTALGLSLDDVMTEEPEGRPQQAQPPAQAQSQPQSQQSDPLPPSWHPHSQAQTQPREAAMAMDPLLARALIGRGEHVQRAAGRRVIKMAGVTWERLTHDDDPLVDFLYVTYAPGSASCSDDDLMRHGGREYGHVVSGRIDIQVGFETYQLAPGDSIHFDSSTPHRLSNPFDEPCVALWVVVGRRGDGRVPSAPGLG